MIVYYKASVSSLYNSRSGWLILGHYSPVMPMSQEIIKVRERIPQKGLLPKEIPL